MTISCYELRILTSHAMQLIAHEKGEAEKKANYWASSVTPDFATWLDSDESTAK